MKHRVIFIQAAKILTGLVLNSVIVMAEDLPPELGLPVDCTPGINCFIQNFVDTDPSPGYRDYHCGYLTYDNHKGTDIRLPNLAMMEAGVRVLAAAPGIVRAVRDGMPDISIRNIDKSLIKDREAGNSVAIRHGDGWETQYSHMYKGSVLVKPGDHVISGQPLGLIGLSGNTEFPHLHFSIRHYGKSIDPFTGLEIGSGCAHTNVTSLWDKPTKELLAYQASGILEAGFTDHMPVQKPLYENLDNKNSLPKNASNIIFWVHIFGVQNGDIQNLEITGPDGVILADKKEPLTRNEARRIAILGKKLREETWTPGIYKGNYLLIRNNAEKPETVINKTYILSID